MDQVKAKNDVLSPVTRFCKLLEEHRRTPEGAVRTSQEFLSHFFPVTGDEARDELFRHMPADVRGPVLVAWGIRGHKSAIRDTDEKVKQVVQDALLAGDVDASSFEDGVAIDILNQWAPLAYWWSFWRGGKQTKKSILRAFTAAYELGLFDAKWFFEVIEAKSGQLKGTDVIAEGLTKNDLTDWLKRIHERGDGSPRGILETLGWEKLVQHTTNESLLAAIDAMARKNGLAEKGDKAEKTEWKTDERPSLVGAGVSVVGNSPIASSVAAPPPSRPASLTPPAGMFSASSSGAPVPSSASVAPSAAHQSASGSSPPGGKKRGRGEKDVKVDVASLRLSEEDESTVEGMLASLELDQTNHDNLDAVAVESIEIETIGETEPTDVRKRPSKFP